MKQTIYFNSKLKYGMFLLFFMALLAFGAFTVLDGKKILFGWPCIGISLPMIFIFLWAIFDSRPRLILDEDGVIDRYLGVGKIFWRDIKDLSVITAYKNDFVCLYMDEDSNQRYLSNVSSIKRKLLTANVALGWPPLNLELSGIKGSTEEIFQAIVQHLEKVNNGGSA